MLAFGHCIETKLFLSFWHNIGLFFMAFEPWGQIIPQYSWHVHPETGDFRWQICDLVWSNSRFWKLMHLKYIRKILNLWEILLHRVLFSLVNKYSNGIGRIGKGLINTQLWAIKWKHNSQWFNDLMIYLHKFTVIIFYFLDIMHR